MCTDEQKVADEDTTTIQSLSPTNQSDRLQIATANPGSTEVVNGEVGSGMVDSANEEKATTLLNVPLQKRVAMRTKKKPSKLKKAPNAPKRFKSAFIFFSAEKHKEIRGQLGDKATSERTASISKLVSEAWKELPSEEKDKREAMARGDRARYELEKSMYKGPWQVPNKRKTKDANAPKRPMSAFLAFANSRRATVKQQMPDSSNGDISRALAAMWKEAPDDIRQRYINEEYEKRQEYIVAISEWRKEDEEKKRMERQQREEVALRLADVASSLNDEHASGIIANKSHYYDRNTINDSEHQGFEYNGTVSSSLYPDFSTSATHRGDGYLASTIPFRQTQPVDAVMDVDDLRRQWMMMHGQHQAMASLPFYPTGTMHAAGLTPQSSYNTTNYFQPSFHHHQHQALTSFANPLHWGTSNNDAVVNEHHTGNFSSSRGVLSPNPMTGSQGHTVSGVNPYWLRYPPSPGSHHQSQYHPSIGYASYPFGWNDTNHGVQHDPTAASASHPQREDGDLSTAGREQYPPSR